VLGIDALHSLVDYFVVNVSSPNTPGLRALQEREPLTALLTGIMERNRLLGAKPVLLKIAPDMEEGQLADIVDIVRQTGLQGIIATNTTVERKGLSSPQHLQSETGGLSGRPLTDKSTAVIRMLRRMAGPEMVIIGVGGIFNAADARQKIEAGANLVQVYTGFIYEGPGIVKNINNGLH
ncbi:MAG: dihydroorotate dehydrogenase (quinone), partial [Bacteroidota bacterium]